MNKINYIKKKHIQKNPLLKEKIEKFTSTIKLKPINEMRNELAEKITLYRISKKNSEKKLVELISSKIKNGSVIFLHGYSKTLIESVKKAKNQDIRFEVYTADSGHLQKGKKTYKELSKLKISVKHFPDLLVPNALENSDILLFESNNAVSGKKINGTAGINNILETAGRKGVLTYALFNEFNHKKISDSENIEQNNLTAVINKEGILRPSEFFRRS